MSETTAAATAEPGRTRSTLVALYVLILRMQVTLWRVVGIAALGAVAVTLALAARGADDPQRVAAEVAIGYGLSFALPLATLWLATSCIGDLLEDQLVVYLWLRPVPRWQLPAAAIAATTTVVLPLVAAPLVIATLVAGADQLIGSVVLASALAVAAYAGLFVALSLWIRRALWVGLLYVLIWENGLARTIEGVSRLSIASYTQSIVADAAGLGTRFADHAPTASVVVPVAVACAGLAIAVLRYRRTEID